MKTFFLIDAHSLIHRSFHALPPLTTPEGEPIQAVYGLASILLKILREDKPDYLVACFDRPEPTFRKEEYIEYKAQRPKTPDNLVPQLHEARELFSNFGIETLDKASFEADDLIATLSEKFKSEPDLKIVILTVVVASSVQELVRIDTKQQSPANSLRSGKVALNSNGRVKPVVKSLVCIVRRLTPLVASVVRPVMLYGVGP